MIHRRLSIEDWWNDQRSKKFFRAYSPTSTHELVCLLETLCRLYVILLWYKGSGWSLRENWKCGEGWLYDGLCLTRLEPVTRDGGHSVCQLEYMGWCEKSLQHWTSHAHALRPEFDEVILDWNNCLTFIKLSFHFKPTLTNCKCCSFLELLHICASINAWSERVTKSFLLGGLHNLYRSTIFASSTWTNRQQDASWCKRSICDWLSIFLSVYAIRRSSRWKHNK